MENDDVGTPEEVLLREARRRFAICESVESLFRQRFLEDLRFVHADSSNRDQWPESNRLSRDQDQKPSVTINMVKQFCRQIINDSLQRKSSIKCVPVNNDASVAGAQGFQACVKHILDKSDFQSIWGQQIANQVYGGRGVLRITTEYANNVDESFEQEIFIRPIMNPLSVYFDPDSIMPDKSDSKFVFIFDKIKKEDFKRIYPEYEDKHIPMGDSGFGDMGQDTWIDKDHIRIAEYFRVQYMEDVLIKLPNRVIRKSETPPEQWQEFEKADLPRKFQKVPQIEWYMIVGNKIVDSDIWIGKYIPVVPVIGEEIRIDGKYDCVGHVRNQQDSQREYNYWASSALEHVALQTKSPWIAPQAAIEGYELYWRTANVKNHSYLPYNHISEEGEQIPPPVRPPAPEMPQAYLMGLDIARKDLMYVTGQYENSVGQASNDRTGRAINERQRPGENATFHYTDNQNISLRHIGRIVVDLVPKIYTEKRMMHVMGEDFEQYNLMIDPTYKESVIDAIGKKIIFNPLMGEYNVSVDTGPDFATKRQESWDAITQILAQSPQLTAVIGDLLFRNADFPGADEIAQRLKRMVPQQALGNQPPPEFQQLIQQAQQLQQQLELIRGENALLKMEIAAKDAKSEVDVYDAETKRFGVLAKLGIPMEDVKELVSQLVLEAMNTRLDPVQESAQSGLFNKIAQGSPQNVKLPDSQTPQNIQISGPPAAPPAPSGPPGP